MNRIRQLTVLLLCLACIVAGCRRSEKVEIVPVVVDAPPAVQAELEQTIGAEPVIYDPNEKTRYRLHVVKPSPDKDYTIAVVKPRRDIDYTIAVVRPDPNIDYKILIVGPPRASRRIGELLQKKLRQRMKKHPTRR